MTRHFETGYWRDSGTCQDRARRLTSATDTNRREQQQSTLDLSGRFAEGRDPLADVDSPQ